MDEDEGDPFVGLGWKAKRVNLANPHIPFNPSPKGGLSGAKQFWDEITPFLQSTKSWKWRMEQEEREQYAEHVRMQGEKC